MNTISELRPGQVLGRYEILAPIGQGGMAAVWAARQWGSRGFSKIVAIKTMLPTISDDPRFERMFLDEARIASRIHHDHVVEILDLGEQNAVLYLVMEWVDGDSLSTIRRAAGSHGGIPVAVAVRLVADACAGLHAAHELCDDEGRSFGLVHRDVSPQNILVGTDGGVKVLDFGVAKVAGRVSDTTNIGHARGKPPYMAPEQALGQLIDRRADIFSLGIVLYQLVADRHPFRGENDIATLHNIISDVPVLSPRTFAPELSEGLECLMLKALERDPARRFQSARDMELGLESLLDNELGRVRKEEIGRLVMQWLGSRGEDRRQALREAIRRADTSETTQVELQSTARASQPSWSGEGPAGSSTPISARERARAQAAYPLMRPGESADERTAATAIDLRAAAAQDQASSLDASERTVADLGPNWAQLDHLTDSQPQPATRERAQSATPSRLTLLVLLAMALGAAVAALVFMIHARSAVDRSGVLRGGEANATGVPTAKTTPTTATVAVPSMSAQVDLNAVTAMPESRPTAEPKSTSVRSKKRVDGPTYNLPPISSPGF